MRFEFKAVVTRMVEEEISIILNARDEVEAEEQAAELISEAPTDIVAVRYLVERRRRHEPESVQLDLVNYDEPRYT